MYCFHEDYIKCLASDTASDTNHSTNDRWLLLLPPTTTVTAMRTS